MREFTPIEKERLEILSQNSIELALISPKKDEFELLGIEVTTALIDYIKKNDIPNFTQHESASLIFDNVAYINGYSIANLSGSLIKSVDPKQIGWIWFEELHQYATPSDILGVIMLERKIYLLNITRIDVVAFVRDAFGNPLNEIVRSVQNDSNAIVAELLTKLNKIAANGPIQSELNADTAVGRMLENLLGLKINSSKKPDYKGIELKAFRENRGNRKTLFAQVPNWEHCKLKSSADILNTFGYKRGVNNKLNCTLSTRVRNSQGLQLRICKERNWLIENSQDPELQDFGVWTLSSLHKSLMEKHFETFWVGFKTQVISDKEHFILSKIIHTKRPILSQFDELLQQGTITVDHLIKKYSSGKVEEKGPLFKIEGNSLQLLFSQCKAYL